MNNFIECNRIDVSGKEKPVVINTEHIEYFQSDSDSTTLIVTRSGSRIVVDVNFNDLISDLCHSNVAQPKQP